MLIGSEIEFVLGNGQRKWSNMIGMVFRNLSDIFNTISQPKSNGFTFITPSSNAAQHQRFALDSDLVAHVCDERYEISCGHLTGSFLQTE